MRLGSLLRLLRSRSLARGVFGGDRLWLGMAILLWGGRFARRFLSGGTPQTVYLEDLNPGERLVIAHPEGGARPTRRQQRKARRKAAN